ncbi:MAG: rRNA (guanine1207-N2)-methyltransferase [Clostridiales bacterium]|jgi:16S rRNA (guanine1207-N2)-methyltransferase|nr:rRNA (guanine1207-N2)-methyltransferase [Clostridiales bacterium]
MSHYFIEDNSKEEIRSFDYRFEETLFHFESDIGLFSKDHVDYASDLLLNAITPFSGSALDLGCGYGPIGIVLAKVYGVDVTMTDVNPKALRFAAHNVALNGVEATLVESDGFEKIESSFDVIVLNPPIHAGKQLIFDLYDGAYAHLVPGGHFYVVIQKRHGAESTQKKLETLFDGACETVYKKKGVFVFKCTKA